MKKNNNKKRMIGLLFIIVSLSINHLSYSQTDSLKSGVIAFHPFHLIQNGIRLDYDRNIGEKQWIQIGPQFYAVEYADDLNYHGFINLIGFGVSGYHRIYLSRKVKNFGTYISYGVSYNYFSLKYEYDSVNSSSIIASNTNINKFGADVIIGYQMLVFDQLVLDLYAGLGGRYSDRQYTGIKHESFSDSMIDYGYTGNVMILGIRLGFCY
jgi:hypothetical protein